jgi:hypothetical protein
MKIKSSAIILISAMIIIGAGSRFLPHWHNFTAVGAISLFGSAYLPKKYLAFVVPAITIWLSNLILNNVFYSHYYESFVWFGQYSIWIYLGFFSMVVIGFLLFNKIRLKNILLASILGSISFFFISNFASFLMDPVYVKNPAGLGAAYIAGIPFFWNTLLSNVIYSLLLFGAYQWVKMGSFKTLLAR